MKLLRTLIAMCVCFQVEACELLVKAVDHSVPDPEEDRKSAYKRGMIVGIQEDGWPWGTSERLPKAVIIKIPMIPKDRALKYMAQQMTNVAGVDEIFRRRLWQIRWADLPASARNKLANNGELTIKATAAYTGPSDYTWAQIKTFFRNLQTNLDETEDL